MIAAECGYYGKLPISPEFLRLHAAGPELRWLDDWLQRGILYAESVEGSQWPAVVAQSELCSFMYVPSSDRIVCGVLFPSQDKAGRFFPFLAFVLLEGNALTRTPWLVPIMASNFLDHMHTLLVELRKNCNWEEFRQNMAEPRTRLSDLPSAKDAFDRFLHEMKAGAWWTAVYGSFDDKRKYRIAETICEVVQELKPQIAKRFSGGLCFPVTNTTLTPQCDVSFWLAACLQSLISDHEQALSLLCFWKPGSPTTRSPALISIGPGSPNMLRFVVSPQAQDDAWVLIGENGDRVDETVKAILDDADLSLAGLLAYFNGGCERS